jgi:hypothetical protein
MTSQMSAAEHIRAAIDQMVAIEDPVVQAQETTKLLEQLRDAGSEARQVRITAVQTLHALGWGYQRIGDEIGVGKARAQQLVIEAKQVRRPGVIETQTRLAATEMRASGASDQEIAEKLIPAVRAYRGGDKVTAKAIAAMLDVPITVVKPILKQVDADVSAAK